MLFLFLWIRSDILFLLGMETTESRGRLAWSSASTCPQDLRSRGYSTSPCDHQSSFLCTNSQRKTEARVGSQYTGLPWWCFRIQGARARSQENWDLVELFGSTSERAENLWIVTYMKYPHQGESKAIIMTNQPAFCLCCLAGHMVWEW